jgi:2-haloacid dehalogenase
MEPAPALAILDVNETLSDLAPLAERFEAAGAPAHLLPTWFAGTLRDGIAIRPPGPGRSKHRGRRGGPLEARA